MTACGPLTSMAQAGYYVTWFLHANLLESLLKYPLVLAPNGVNSWVSVQCTSFSMLSSQWPSWPSLSCQSPATSKLQSSMLGIAHTKLSHNGHAVISSKLSVALALYFVQSCGSSRSSPTWTIMCRGTKCLWKNNSTANVIDLPKMLYAHDWPAVLHTKTTHLFPVRWYWPEWTTRKSPTIPLPTYTLQLGAALLSCSSSTLTTGLFLNSTPWTGITFMPLSQPGAILSDCGSPNNIPTSVPQALKWFDATCLKMIDVPAVGIFMYVLNTSASAPVKHAPIYRTWQLMTFSNGWQKMTQQTQSSHTGSQNTFVAVVHSGSPSLDLCHPRWQRSWPVRIGLDGKILHKVASQPSSSPCNRTICLLVHYGWTPWIGQKSDYKCPTHNSWPIASAKLHATTTSLASSWLSRTLICYSI